MGCHCLLREKAGIDSDDLNVNQALLVIGVLVTHPLGHCLAAPFSLVWSSPGAIWGWGELLALQGATRAPGNGAGTGSLEAEPLGAPHAQVREPSGEGGCLHTGLEGARELSTVWPHCRCPFLAHLGPAQPSDQGPSIHTCPSQLPHTAEPSRMLSPRSKPRLVPHMCPLGLHMAQAPVPHCRFVHGQGVSLSSTLVHHSVRQDQAGTNQHAPAVNKKSFQPRSHLTRCEQV